MNPGSFAWPHSASSQQTCASRAPLDEAHHTEQRGTQKSSEAEIHYVFHRCDAAALVCVRTATPVDRHAGLLGTRAAGAGAFSRLSLVQLDLTQFERAEAMVSSALGKRQNTLGHQEAA